jgi:hypothetical protein
MPDPTPSYVSHNRGGGIPAQAIGLGNDGHKIPSPNATLHRSKALI